MNCIWNEASGAIRVVGMRAFDRWERNHHASPSGETRPLLSLKSMTRRQPTSNGADPATMQEYAFQVKLVAVVRVRAADEALARKVVPSVLGSPGTMEITLADGSNISLVLMRHH